MIGKISFKNYKGFKNGELDLKPITILLGANSSGKSSIIQLILLMAQTVNYNKRYKSALRLNGELVRLGEVENIFLNKNINIPIELEITLNGFSIRHQLRKLKDSIEDIYFSLDKINTMFDEKENIINIQKSISYRSRNRNIDDSFIYHDLLRELSKVKRQVNIKLNKIDPEIAEETIIRYFRHPRIRRIRNSIYSKETNKIVADFQPFKLAFELLENINKVPIDEVFLKYRIFYNIKLNKLDVDKISIGTTNQNILTYSYERVQRGKHHVLSSDLLDEKILEKYNSKFGNQISFEGLTLVQKERSQSKNNQNEDVFMQTLFELFQGVTELMDYELDYDKINYVSPLRAFPKRYYFLDESVVNNSLNTIDGNQLAEILHENIEIRKKVNTWLERFKFKVSVSQLKDVIHNIRITQSGLNLDITDVGFGISQVLPVIVQGFLSSDDSLTIIEQPEIHLHPRMQAELADLFIDIVDRKSKYDHEKVLIIETHSEYLLKRLRRRMAEGAINPNDVAIYFIDPKDKDVKHARLRKIDISESGSFKWPIDFYIDDLNDTIEFLKYQK